MTPLEIEDYFMENLVFQNGFKTETPTIASLDAYGTVIKYNNLYAAIEKLMPIVTTEQWDKAIEYWNYESYLAPTFKLLAIIVKRKVAEFNKL
jgi:hypothetical protein